MSGYTEGLKRTKEFDEFIEKLNKLINDHLGGIESPRIGDNKISVCLIVAESDNYRNHVRFMGGLTDPWVVVLAQAMVAHPKLKELVDEYYHQAYELRKKIN